MISHWPHPSHSYDLGSPGVMRRTVAFAVTNGATPVPGCQNNSIIILNGRPVCRESAKLAGLRVGPAGQ